MNSLGSWIDPQLMAGAAQELAGRVSLAEEFALLLTGPNEASAISMDDFSGVTGTRPHNPLPAEEQVKVRNLLEDVKRRASRSGLLSNGGAAAVKSSSMPGSDPASTPGPLPQQSIFNPYSAPKSDQDAIISRRGLPFFVPPLGPLATRIRAFMDWLKRQVTAESMFIVDAQGCPVTDSEPSAEILAGAILLADAARRAARHVPSTGEGALHVDLPHARKLCIIHTETNYGHFCLGIISREPLAPQAADRLRSALKRTVESDGDTGPVRVERQ